MCEIHAESTFRVEGMDCTEEVTTLERCLTRLAGVENASADLLGQRIRVTHDAARIPASAIAEAVARTGMRAWLEHDEAMTPPAGSRLHHVLLVVSGSALGLALALPLMGVAEMAIRSLLVVSMAAGGLFAGRRAIRAARALTLDINVLMLVAVIGAVAIGEWFEGAAVIFLFALAQQLESRSLDRARGAIRALMELAPAVALVQRGSSEQHLRVEDVRVGDVVIVRPGEKVPLDGVVRAGRTHVNQAPLTGESLPVDKCPGDTVFAGTINGPGALEVHVTRPYHDTTLARITDLVEQAQAQRAPTPAFVDRFTKFYTPAVISLASLVAVVPPIMLGEPFGAWIYRALVLLVIACPCALVISTPVSIVSALAGAARRGVLFRGGIHLERTGAVRCIAFDKTGTLTKGQFEVIEIVGLNGTSPSTILTTAAALERRSEHPIARAIVRRAAQDGIRVVPGEAVRALPGRGAEGRVGRAPALIGSHRLFHERQLCSPAVEARLEAFAERGYTSILVASEGRTIGLIAVADAVREMGRESISLLRRQGIDHVVLLTGDSERAAGALARDLNLDEIRAELLPEDKQSAIAELQQRYGVVAMVGDGVNDAPALAAADVGVAMGAAGTDTALETADVALMADELLKIPYAVRLSRATVRTIHVNVTLSLALKAAFLGMAVTGIATLWMAVAADMGASLLVIANGLRLLRAD